MRALKDSIVLLLSLALTTAFALIGCDGGGSDGSSGSNSDSLIGTWEIAVGRPDTPTLHFYTDGTWAMIGMPLNRPSLHSSKSTAHTDRPKLQTDLDP